MEWLKCIGVEKRGQWASCVVAEGAKKQEDREAEMALKDKFRKARTSANRFLTLADVLRHQSDRGRVE